MSSEPRITLSEDRLRAILAEFKLELVKDLEGYATKLQLEGLEARIRLLELAAAASAAASALTRWFWPLFVAFVAALAAIAYLFVHGNGHG